MPAFAYWLLWASLASPATVNWPGFRGTGALGVAEGSVATTWNADATAGPRKNVKWTVPMPGLAHSSPVIWGDKIFVTTAISSAGEAPLKVGLYGAGDPAEDNAVQRWVVYCLDKKTGKTIWQQVAYEGPPKTKRHTKATHANASPVTDGKRLVVFFGSEGVYTYDLNGKLLWKKDLGVFDIGPQGYDLQWGNASSPVLFEDKVVLQCDQKKGSFLVVLSANDGKEVWRTQRDGISNHSWATPAVVRDGPRTQVVCNGWPFIASYDFASGKELWRIKSAGDIPVPTPIFENGLIYVTNAHGGPAPLYAIKPTATGDLSAEMDSKERKQLAWYEPRNGAYMQTPVIVNGLLYSCSDRGVLKVYDAKTGTMQYTERLGSGTTGFSASPVAINGSIYFASEEGEVYVIKAGPKFELVAKNLLGEISMASPAISENVIYYRTRAHMVAIAQ